MFELEVFRNRISNCIELKKVLVTLSGLISATRSHLAPLAVVRRSHSGSAPGELCPLLFTPIPCLYRCKVVYDFIKVSFRCFVPFYSHQS